MLPLMALVLLIFPSDCLTKPTTESTHTLLQRLGFDQVQKPVVNHHKKRLAQEINKARHHIEGYNTETDSHMFVVKLPPHYPYYSHMTPEKFDNEVMSKSSVKFQTNGKPAGVYHWNIPVLKKVPQARFGLSRISQGDSKVYHVKILSNRDYKGKERPYKKISKLKKQRYEDGPSKIKQTNYLKNNTRLQNIKNSDTKKNPTTLLKKPVENGRMDYLKQSETNHLLKTKNKNYIQDKMNESLVRDAANSKDKRQRSPSYYQLALPKHNSFQKDFTGNGKPKSFYVIEKSKKTSQYHRLF